MTLLPDREIDRRLSELDGWARDGSTICKQYEFEDFASAMAFVNRVADLATRTNHHPDIQIAFRVVTLSFMTYDEGGLTDLDLDGAGEADQLVDPPAA